MRISTALLASVVLANVGMAQINGLNEFEYGYCGATSFTSRAGLGGTVEGWVTSRTVASYVRGSLMINDPVTGLPTTRVNGLRCVNQDQSCITTEQFELGAFLDDAVTPGQPDPNVDPVTLRPVPAFSTGVVSLPVSTITTPCAWIWTLTFATPVDGVLPLDQDYYLGMWCPANGAWTADGVSLHESEMSAGNTGDNPSIAAQNAGAIPNLVHNINISGGNVIGGNYNTRFQRVWAFTEGPTFRLGADIDPAQNGTRVAPPNFGVAGMFPDHAVRLDGLALRVHNYPLAANPVMPGITLMSFGVQGNGGWNPTPVNPFVPGIGQQGNFYLDIVGFGILGITIPTDLSAGVHQSTVVPFGLLNQAYGVLTFQHVTLDLVNAKLLFTNGQKMNSL